MTTKEKILQEALALFSVRGYDSVSVRDISGSVGIRESALYKHYKNKQDIYDSIVAVAKDRVHTLQVQLQAIAEQHQSLSTVEQLQAIFGTMFSFYLTDEIMSPFRKMMTIEQYKDSASNQLFREMFIDKTLHYQTEVFRRAQAEGLMKQGNPSIMALQFYSPILVLLLRYDDQVENASEALEIVRQHIQLFFERMNHE